MQTRGELEAAVADAMNRFQQEYMGHGPKHIRCHVIGDLVIVRMGGVLTSAEQHLAKNMPGNKGQELLKQVHCHLIETARPVLEATISQITGMKVVSLHHDISTRTGEEVVLFTLEDAKCRKVN